MLQVYVLNVSAILKRMLQVFYLDVAYVALAIHVYCKYMFQMFQLFQTYVTNLLCGCCICYSAHTHMLQAYVVNVSSISDVCCCKYFMLQVFHQQARLEGIGRGGPLGCTGSQADATVGAEHKVVSTGMAAGIWSKRLDPCLAASSA
jgi:hypothetical protein